MSTFNPFIQIIVEAVAGDELLGDTFAEREADWLATDLPPSREEDGWEADYPCVRFSIIDSRNNRQREYTISLNLWDTTDNSAESTLAFYAKADALEAALNAAPGIMLRGGYKLLPEPANGLNHALWIIRYIAGPSD